MLLGAGARGRRPFIIRGGCSRGGAARAPSRAPAGYHRVSCRVAKRANPFPATSPTFSVSSLPPPPPPPPRSLGSPLLEGLTVPAQTGPPHRDWLLRCTLFTGVLGATLAIVHAFFLGSFNELDSVLQIDAASYHQVLVPLLALAALAGALILERQPAGGMVLLLAGTLLGLFGGTLYLVPAALLGAAWAVRHSTAARLILGFLLLVPGILSVYYGVLAMLSWVGGDAMPGLPPGLDHPVSLHQAVLPFVLLPAALLGAWLLADNRRAAD